MRSREDIDSLARAGILLTCSCGKHEDSKKTMGATLLAVAQWLTYGECDIPSDMPRELIEHVMEDITALVACAKAIDRSEGT